MDRGEFLGQVALFSDKVIRDVLREVVSRSPWCSGRWTGGAPTGAVLHYTADPDLASVLRWFLRREYGAKASAHYVVAPAWDDILRGAARGLPLVEELAVPMVEVVPPELVAWHAQRANQWAIGVEVVNAGRLRRTPAGEWRRWQPERLGAEEWTSPYLSGQLGAPRWRNLDGVHWYAPYQPAQESAASRVVEEVARAFHGHPFDAVRIVGHENVQRNKQDPGPEFAMQVIRAAGLPDEQRVHRINAMCDLWLSGAGQELIKAPYESRPMPASPERDRLALVALGYADASSTSVEMFQAMMGIQVDGVIGPGTCMALGVRLEEVGFALGDEDPVAA